MVDEAKLDEAIKVALTPGKYAVVLVATSDDGNRATQYIRNRYRGRGLEVRIKDEPGEETVYIDAESVST